MRIHFIAIGGAAMHNLALALHFKGETVTGSDDTIFEPSKSRLEKQGLLPDTFGWFPEKITKDIDAVILGMHAKIDNPELKRAEELGLTMYSYPEYLYEQSKDKTRVVIGGSHGKTTITSMILHVMNYWDKDVDYMVGAQLEGFDTMVHLTHDNDFIVLEGDEYLSSPIDRRPKFHLYQPNIALISGIAWDHINVFPTFDNYVEQFQIFVNGMTNGTPDGPMPIEIFGKHNLNNLAGAKWICQHMGVVEADFYEAIATFKGASKRLEKIGEGVTTAAYKDYAHSPSKVAATTQAVKEQYPNRTLMACLELHTYSSLNADFLKEYKGALAAADVAAVFYSPHAVAIKKLDTITEQQIFDAFEREDLHIFTDPEAFQDFLFGQSFDHTTLLLMSSGNYGGLDFEKVNNFIK